MPRSTPIRRQGARIFTNVNIVTAAFCSGGEERVRHFHNGGGWVRRRECVRSGAVIIRITLPVVRARCPENGREPQRGGEKAHRMCRGGGAAAGGWRSPEEFSRHLGRSQPKWRSAWMWRQCNARTRSQRAAEERAGGRPEL